MTLQDLEQMIATTIGQQETGNGTAGVGLSLNNPGGIKFADWETAYGATTTASGFAKFPTLAKGRDAMLALIDKYVQSGASLTTLLEGIPGGLGGWSPSSDNNTNNPARISQLAQQTGLDPTLPIAQSAAAATGSFDWKQILADALKRSAAGATGVGAIGGAITESIKNTDSATSAAAATLWGRVAAFVVGIVLLIAGIAFLKQTQVLVQPIVNKAKSAVSAAAIAA